MKKLLAGLLVGAGASALYLFFKGSASQSSAAPLDINSAERAALLKLDGIDDFLADRILENRPYATKIDLIGRRVIPDGAYALIRHRIFVEHAA